VTLVAPSTMPGEPIPGIDRRIFRSFRTGLAAIDLAMNGAAFPLRVRRFRQIIHETRSDLLHVHYVDDAAVAAVATDFRPLVVTAWGSDVLLRPRLLRGMIRYVLRRADLITCDAEHMQRALVGQGAEPERVRIVGFGTDTEQFRPRPNDPTPTGSSDRVRPVIVISLRTLKPIYDIETLITAAPTILRRFPQVIFRIAGAGPCREALQSQAVRLGVAANVQFLGQVAPEHLPRVLADADLYVSTALADGGIAASTSEAMACGLPVVITDVADNRRWVNDGVNGLLIPGRDPAALADRILRLVQDPEECQSLGEAARRTIVERNDWATEMGKMEKLYQECLKGARQGKE